MRQLSLICALLVTVPLTSGCILPFAYPTLSSTPRVELGTASSNVHAFRVDFTNHTADLIVGDRGRGTERLSKVSIASTGAVPAQFVPSASYGLLILGVALNYPTLTSHTVALRVYRPGFELVEIESWTRGQKITWTAAPDLASQERALDSLFPLSQLDKECTAREHHEALLFGATEYDRLAGEARREEDQNRLNLKAVILRERTILQNASSQKSDEA